MGFLDPKDCEPRDLRAYRQAIESMVPIELESLSYNSCHFVRARIAARVGLPENVYQRLRHDQWNCVRLNVLENRCPNAAQSRESLLLEEKRLLSLLREHRKPYHRQMPWLITKKGAEFCKHHWSPKVRWRVRHHLCCPGSKVVMWRPWYTVCIKRWRRVFYNLWSKVRKQSPP